MAAWVLDGARLISSASTMFAKTGPFANSNARLSAGKFLQDIGAGNVHRHQVRRELDAAEAERHRLRQPADEQRLRQPRHAHEQRMAAREKADGQLLDHLILADDDFLQLRA